MKKRGGGLSPIGGRALELGMFSSRSRAPPRAGVLHLHVELFSKEFPSNLDGHTQPRVAHGPVSRSGWKRGSSAWGASRGVSGRFLS